MSPTEAFLSHSSQDRAAADQLASVLRAHGVPVFYSPHNILGAQQWHGRVPRSDRLHACQSRLFEAAKSSEPKLKASLIIISLRHWRSAVSKSIPRHFSNGA